MWCFAKVLIINPKLPDLFKISPGEWGLASKVLCFEFIIINLILSFVWHIFPKDIKILKQNLGVMGKQHDNWC